ncbi:MAG: TIGR04222 domain-containing membrane protein, partial [Actinomycetota bacterium]|nr:TIGR04222 domain-containing membrane protein [Actinomycetota bacterium]
MNEPWGITGPDFLRIYLVGFAFALLSALALRIMARTGSAGGRTTGDAIGHDQLDMDELAYLAGGARRVVETSVARLLDQGKVRANRTGMIRVVEGANAMHAVDAAVLADAKRYGNRTLGLLIDRVGKDQAVR